jgi:hypothetical protein
MNANFVFAPFVMLWLVCVHSAHNASLYLRSKNTGKCGEATPPHDVIDVVIDYKNSSTLRRALTPLPGIPDRDPIEHQANHQHEFVI